MGRYPYFSPIHTTQFDISGRFEVPRSPQGHPVLLQAGDSDEGREFGAAKADAIFTGHGTLEEGHAFYADVKGRLAKYGRSHADLKILPAATFVLGDSAEDAAERARHIRLQQVSPQTAIAFLEQVWGRDLSGYDPEGVTRQRAWAPARNVASSFAKERRINLLSVPSA
nr:LLM class flavin-dependent oxidoreductase [Pseudomonas sp. ALS1131]